MFKNFIIFNLCINVTLLFGQDFEKHTDGTEIKKYISGQVESILVYRNNKLDSVCSWFFENGNLKSKINFRNGKKNGVSHYFNEKGELTDIYYSQNDSTKLHLQFNAKGIIFKENVNREQFFYLNGQQLSNQEFINRNSTKKKSSK